MTKEIRIENAILNFDGDMLEDIKEAYRRPSFIKDRIGTHTIYLKGAIDKIKEKSRNDAYDNVIAYLKRKELNYSKTNFSKSAMRYIQKLKSEKHEN